MRLWAAAPNFKRTIELTFKQQKFMIFIVGYIFQNKIWKKENYFQKTIHLYKNDFLMMFVLKKYIV